MKAIFVFTAALAFVLSPLASEGFNGFRPDQFPVPQVEPPVQPAGYAFAIWGVIYLWLIAGAAFGLFARHDSEEWAAMRWPLIGSLVIGAAWIPVAQSSPVQATVMIWLMLGLAVWSLLAAGPGDRIWQRGPVALYAGWLTAASCVALALVLAGHGYLGAQAAALVIIPVALAIALGVQTLRADAPEYALGVIWALVGIIVANSASANWPVLVLALLGIGVLAGLALRGLRS